MVNPVHDEQHRNAPGDRPPDRPKLSDRIRQQSWPDRGLVRAVAIYMLIAYLPMLWHVFGEATGKVGSDFQAFWGAGRLVMAGNPWSVYDFMAEHAAQKASNTGHFVPFVNPPPYLFLTAPLAMMPYGVAWLAWALGGWAMWFAVCRRLLPGQALALAACPTAYLAACHAQNGFVTGALLVGGVMALSHADRRNDRIAGALFGALIIKPHLALLVPLWLIAGRRWGALAAMAASATALCLLSLVAFGPQTWIAWPRSFAVSVALVEHSRQAFFLRMASPYALIRVLVGANAALAAQGVIALGMATLVWRQTRQYGVNAATGALMLATTALASPYLFSYDLPFLVQPVLWLVTSARANGWRPWEKAAVIALWLAPLATRLAALPLHANLMPLASMVLTGMIVSRLRASSVDNQRMERAKIGVQ